MSVTRTEMNEVDGAVVEGPYGTLFHLTADDVRALPDEEYDRWDAERKLEALIEPLFNTEVKAHIIELEPLWGRLECYG